MDQGGVESVSEASAYILESLCSAAQPAEGLAENITLKAIVGQITVLIFCMILYTVKRYLIGERPFTDWVRDQSRRRCRRRRPPPDSEADSTDAQDIPKEDVELKDTSAPDTHPTPSNITT